MRVGVEAIYGGAGLQGVRVQKVGVREMQKGRWEERAKERG